MKTLLRVLPLIPMALLTLQSAEASTLLARSQQLRIDDLVVVCPPGTTRVPFEMPIYDEETGLFVIGYETVYYCIPDNTQPAG